MWRTGTVVPTPLLGMRERTSAGRLRGRAVWAVATVIAVIGATAAASGALAQAKLDKVNFGGSVTWLGQVPIMAAIEKGFFKEQGLDVEFKTILSSGDRVSALTAGSIDFSNLGRVAVIAEMARGNESFYYFANVDDSPGNEGCWARQGISSIKELKGKKVAANTSAEITLAGLLRANGMTQKDIQYLNLPPNEMAPALAKGDLDAACVWQPLLNGLKEAAPSGKLLGTDKETETYAKFKTMASPDIMIISRKLVDQNPEKARKTALAVMKGAEFATENPEETAKLVAHYFKRPAEEVLAGMKTFQYFGMKNWPDHMKLHTQQMQELAQWLYDNNKIGNLPDAKKWEKTDFIPKPST
jgi:ABC-type nitrate/sulfonate/bicarbonate transport system substrate-binding protein